MDQPLKADPLEFSSYTKELPFLYLCGGLSGFTGLSKSGKARNSRQHALIYTSRWEFTIGVYNRSLQ